MRYGQKERAGRAGGGQPDFRRRTGRSEKEPSGRLFGTDPIAMFVRRISQLGEKREWIGRQASLRTDHRSTPSKRCAGGSPCTLS